MPTAKKGSKAPPERKPSVEQLKGYVTQSVDRSLREQLPAESLVAVKQAVKDAVEKHTQRLDEHYRDHYKAVSTEFRAKVEDEAKAEIKDAIGAHDGAMPPKSERFLRWFLVGLNDYLDVNRAYPTGAVIPSDRWFILKKLMDPSSQPQRFRFATITVQSCTELDGSDRLIWCYDSRRASP